MLFLCVVYVQRTCVERDIASFVIRELYRIYSGTVDKGTHAHYYCALVLWCTDSIKTTVLWCYGVLTALRPLCFGVMVY